MMSVLTKPGTMEVTETPNGSTSMRSDSVIMAMAAFELCRV